MAHGALAPDVAAREATSRVLQDDKGGSAVISVIFEVEPAEGRFDEYLDHAARLRPELERMPGFISVERFRSLTNP